MTEIKSVKFIRDTRNSVADQCGGIYKWWCKKELLEEFINQLRLFNETISFDEIIKYVEQNDNSLYCFYVGQTKSSLRSRIRSQHIGKRGKKNPTFGRAIKGSTLRRTINALKNNDGRYDEDYVDKVLDECFVQWQSLETNRIDEEERNEINSYIRIFNIDDIANSNDENFNTLRAEVRDALKEARKKHIENRKEIDRIMNY